MFGDKDVSPKLRDVFDEFSIPFTWCGPTLSADTVVFHNPSCLKFQDTLGASILAQTLIVVTHENFYRPSGAPAFDIDATLGVVADATLARRKVLAPISPYNRAGVMHWVNTTPACEWEVLDQDWFNICDFELTPPTAAPRDRRGRLSRPGNEKFPLLAALDQSFPPMAETNLILGADSLMPFAAQYPHWDLRPFGSMAVDAFFDKIDFMVYHTSASWRESFGRVIAEAIAAGKVVITDAETGANFGAGSTVAAGPSEVSSAIAALTAEPAKYRKIVETGQKNLARHASDRFRAFFDSVVPG
ncbi:MAG: hypothetical protein AAF092_10805 [Pseudomonadota bacterium]